MYARVCRAIEFERVNGVGEAVCEYVCRVFCWSVLKYIHVAYLISCVLVFQKRVDVEH